MRRHAQPVIRHLDHSASRHAAGRTLRTAALPVQRSPGARWLGAALATGAALVFVGIASQAPSRLLSAVEVQPGRAFDAGIGLLGVVVLGVGAAILWRWRSSASEVTRWRNAHEAARQLSPRDPLTGLMNRRRLMVDATLALSRMRRGRGPIGIVAVELDGFAAASAAAGTRGSDALLATIGSRLTATLRDSDIAARLSGARFAILAELRTPEDAARLALRLVSDLNVPYEIDGTTITLQARIGIATAPEDADKPEALIASAGHALDQALEEAAAIRFFGKGMNERVRQRAELLTALGEAIARDEVLPHFQPIVDLQTRRICGFEALARWWQSPRRMISPGEFIPLAEEGGLISALTCSLLHRACLAAQAWPSDMMLALNVSASEIRDPALPARLRSVLDATGFPAERLEVEIAESALDDETGTIRANLAELKAVGVRLSLDDFGTGRVGLHHLHAMPFDRIKVDAGFVRPLGARTGDERVVTSAVALAHAFGLTVVAEGTETEAEAAALLALGCDAAQGHWFGRPLPAEDVNAIFNVVE